MQTTFRRGFLLPIVAGAVLLAGCEPTAAALPRLTEPGEVLEEALRTTAELEFVHIRLEATFRGDGVAGVGLGETAVTVDGDLDLGTREFHALAEATMSGVAQRVELLLVGTDAFVRTEGGLLPGQAGRWQRQPIPPGEDPRNGIPPNPAIAVALKAMLEEPTLESELVGIESCGASQCYHVTVAVAPELTWRIVNGAFFGGPPEDELGPVDPSIPPITVDLMVQESTRLLVSASTTVAAAGVTVAATVTLSNHDREFQLLPPPPDQVDDGSGAEGPLGG